MRDRFVKISTSRNETDGVWLLVALTEHGNIFVATANDDAKFEDWNSVELPPELKAMRAA
jgi:hypothetical protein